MGNIYTKRPTNIIVPLEHSSPNGIPLEGTGKYTTKDGTTYIGNFHQGGFHGRGSFRYTDGAIYKGDWLAHQRHGKGTLQYISGESYEGDFLYDEIHGWGKLVYNSGDIFEGQFLFGCQNGIGTYLDAEAKRVYHGQWFNNLFHGHGIYYHNNGRRMYDGNWKCGLAHGFGTLYDSNGKRVYRGMWVDGVMSKLHSNSSTASESPILTSNPANSTASNNEIPYYALKSEEQKEVNKQRILLNPLTQIKDRNEFDFLLHPVSISEISEKISFNPVRISRVNSRKTSPHLKPMEPTALYEPENKSASVVNPFSILNSICNHPLGLQTNSIPEDDKNSDRSESPKDK
jgi:hypothetical protein